MSRFVPWSKKHRLPASQSAPESSSVPLIHDNVIRRHTGLTLDDPPYVHLVLNSPKQLLSHDSHSEKFGLELWAEPDDYGHPEAM